MFHTVGVCSTSALDSSVDSCCSSVSVVSLGLSCALQNVAKSMTKVPTTWGLIDRHQRGR